MENDLRNQVKLLKALQGITYKEIASYLEIKTNSIYNWLNYQFELSPENEERLIDIISNLKE